MEGKKSLLFLDCLQHSWSKCSTGIIISRGIIGPLRDTDGFRDTINKVNSKAFASANDSNGRWARMGHLHVEGLRQLTCWIAHEGNVGVLYPLVFCPSIHDGTVVHAVHKYFVNARGLERVYGDGRRTRVESDTSMTLVYSKNDFKIDRLTLMLKVTRDLLVGSGGCESTWKANEDQIFAFAVVCKVHHFRRKAAVKVN
jgi:hypothetical protein